jgi:simple sugar transport system ATP-binding protein
MMLGRGTSFEPRRTPHPPGDIILSVKDLVVLGDRGIASVCDLSFEIRAGEILGIAGVAGNGQRELFEAIVGARKVQGGEIFLKGMPLTNLSPAEIIEKGIGYIPDDRYRAGLIGEFSIEENLILGLHKRQFSHRSLLDFPRVAEFGRQAMNEFGIVASSAKALADTLSGGNAQKVILARELKSCTSCLLANQPSRGLDLGVKEYVHQMLLKKRSEDFAILLASEELDDILLLSDLIAVMFKGQFMGIFRPDDTNVRQIGLLMAGQSGVLH